MAEAAILSSPSSSAPASAPSAAPSAPASGSPPSPTTATTSDPSQAAAPASAPVAPTRPEGVPDKYWNAEKGVDHSAWSKDYNEFVAFKAEQDVKRLTLPATKDDYKAELPADFKPPEGVEWKFRTDDPLLDQFKALAHESGMSQDAFKKALGLYAGAQVSTEAQIQAARQAEFAKLGATGPALVGAVSTWLDSQGFGSLKSGLLTAAHVNDMAKLMNRVVNQGGGTFNAAGREPGPSEKVDQKTYDSWSYAEKMAYARKHNGG